MSPTPLPLSGVPALRTIELTDGSEPLLQRFFDANPAYFFAVYGEPAPPNEAHEEIHDDLPGWTFTKKWVVGYTASTGALVAMATIISDILAPAVWHIGTFIVETSRHGNGDAKLLYDQLESWALSSGAAWLRLGVVRGNARAERFWEARGFVETRTREGVPMGKRINTLRVMVKPLTGGSIEHYLTLVPRDRPQPQNGL